MPQKSTISKNVDHCTEIIYSGQNFIGNNRHLSFKKQSLVQFELTWPLVRKIM